MKLSTVKKAVLFLVAAMITAMTLVACKTSGQETGSGSTGTHAPGTSVELELPDKKYNGYEFRVFCRPQANADDVWSADLFATSEDSTRVGSAVYKRVQWVSTLLDCKLTYTLSSNSNMETDAMNVLFAGEDAHDLLMPHGRSIMTYADEGYLLA